jgi:hypothetical protein
MTGLVRDFETGQSARASSYEDDILVKLQEIHERGDDVSETVEEFERYGVSHSSREARTLKRSIKGYRRLAEWRASEGKSSLAGNAVALCECVANSSSAHPVLISALTLVFALPTMVHRVATKGAQRREEYLGTSGGRKLTASRVVNAIRARRLRHCESRLG